MESINTSQNTRPPRSLQSSANNIQQGQLNLKDQIFPLCYPLRAHPVDKSMRHTSLLAVSEQCEHCGAVLSLRWDRIVAVFV